MFLGLDLGTSSLKALLVDGDQQVIASAEAALEVSQPALGHREQDPEDWWQALLGVMDDLQHRHPRDVAAIKSIGLSGQMHGAVLLNASGVVLRPCILWNDGRAAEECRLLEHRLPDLAAITGNVAMPGFTSPKLLWVRRHEPDVFACISTVLLPKSWLRFRMTGEMIEEMSDASGTLWLDTGARDWSDAALAATGLDRTAMPRLVEGAAAAGRLRHELAARWGMKEPPLLAGGAGDNAAGAVGLSAIFSLRGCLDAVRRSGTVVDSADVIGGGSRSAAWVRMLACVLDIPLHRIEGGEQCAAFGAARLARLAFSGERVAEVCKPRRRLETMLPDAGRRVAYERQYTRHQALTQSTRKI